MGRLLDAGTNPSALSARDWLDFVYYVRVSMPDFLALGFGISMDRDKVMDLLDKQLAKAVGPGHSQEWGKSPRAVEGQRAMMAAAGGPSPLRPKNAQRPAAWKAREGGTPSQS